MGGILALGLDVVDAALDLAGVLLSSAAIGSGFGVTAAVLNRRSPRTIEAWGLIGTAYGFILGIFLASCVLAARA